MKGQCHRYKGYMMRPIHTSNLFEIIYLLTNASLPACRINADPMVGNKETNPGTCDS